ncbi:adenylyl-sulfate kinase [Egicoccus halophilus]|uniref:Adenylyl-sulfate kinase n=1 Tax=Egicoccus halophilus TaxID=1670830 RepID=A0A8J3ESB8_9ACTN|nr:adenylyl-sulfate kinase [Egicoccus halophilus]GGI02650.1 hypothetical protein GCM10011354_01080 [Egicoccus halophilus]
MSDVRPGDTPPPTGGDHHAADAPGPTAGWADEERAEALRAASTDWPSSDLTDRDLDDLELVLDGLLEPHPLSVPREASTALDRGTPLALRDPEGTMVAVLRVARVLDPVPASDATGGDRAGDDGAGGDADAVRVAGELVGVTRPVRWSFSRLRATPSELRTRLAVHDQVVAVLTDRALHRADVDDLRAEVAADRAHLLLVQLERREAGADTTAAVTRALEAMLHELRVPSTLTLLPAPARLFDDRHDERLDAIAGVLGASRRLRLGRTGVDVDAAIRAGDPVSADATFATVAAELRAAHPPRHDRGLVVLFTGLSGSGKSTVANALRGRLLERGDRRVTLLDGDLVRRHLSRGLGFSPQDRATNVRRIGYVAAEIARHGGLVLCAPIAPEAGVRDEVRTMVEDAGAGFVLVHVATPLEVCEQRDRKGLYAKARAGQVRDFTGIDAPYDVPVDPELRVDTVDTTPDACATRVLDDLVARGWLTAR